MNPVGRKMKDEFDYERWDNFCIYGLDIWLLCYISNPKTVLSSAYHKHAIITYVKYDQ